MPHIHPETLQPPIDGVVLTWTPGETARLARAPVAWSKFSASIRSSPVAGFAFDGSLERATAEQASRKWRCDKDEGGNHDLPLATA